jgi:lipopolysaccharide transport system permease protein
LRLTADTPAIATVARATSTVSADTPAPAMVFNEPPLTVIEPRGRWSVAELRELWRYRDLFLHLVLRDVKLRYKQTILGFGWALFQPLMTMVVFALFLGRMGGVGRDVDDYFLFVLVGAVPWTFFSNALTTAGNSLVSNERLVTKVYFPRVLVPAACVGAAVFDLVVALSLVAVGMAVAGVAPPSGVLLLPVVVALLVMCALGFGVLLAALIVAQRDFRYLLSFGMQVWMFATPVIYLNPTTLGPAAQTWLPLNPVYGLILAFRSAVLGTPMDWAAVGVSAAVSVAMLAFGLWYFRRVERAFADVI